MTDERLEEVQGQYDRMMEEGYEYEQLANFATIVIPELFDHILCKEIRIAELAGRIEYFSSRDE